MKKIIVAAVLASGVAGIAFASLNTTNKKEKSIEKKVEKKKKKDCKRVCLFS